MDEKTRQLTLMEASALILEINTACKGRHSIVVAIAISSVVGQLAIEVERKGKGYTANDVMDDIQARVEQYILDNQKPDALVTN